MISVQELRVLLLPCRCITSLSGSAAAQGSSGAPSQEPRRNCRARLAACMSGSLSGDPLDNLAMAVFQATCAQLALPSSPSPSRSWWNFSPCGAASSLSSAVSSGTMSLCFPESTDCSLLPNSVAQIKCCTFFFFFLTSSTKLPQHISCHLSVAEVQCCV